MTDTTLPEDAKIFVSYLCAHSATCSCVLMPATRCHYCKFIPGSPESVAAGCTCPVELNNGGDPAKPPHDVRHHDDFRGGSTYGWFVSDKCRLHREKWPTCGPREIGVTTRYGAKCTEYRGVKLA